MSDVTVEQKLQLLQQIRSRYSENQYDLHNRERILYGQAAGGYSGKAASSAPEEQDTGQTPAVSRFRLRLLLAVLFLGALVFMEKNHIEVAGITAEVIQRVISADYEEKIDAWAEGLSRVFIGLPAP